MRSTPEMLRSLRSFFRLRAGMRRQHLLLLQEFLPKLPETFALIRGGKRDAIDFVGARDFVRDIRREPRVLREHIDLNQRRTALRFDPQHLVDEIPVGDRPRAAWSSRRAAGQVSHSVPAVSITG